MNEPAEAFESTDFADGWCRRWLRGLSGLEPEGAMRPLGVVVLDEDAQDAHELAAVDDWQPVGTFRANGPDEPLGDGFRLGRPHRGLHDRMPRARNTPSNDPLYFISRSRISSARRAPLGRGTDCVPAG